MSIQPNLTNNEVINYLEKKITSMNQEMIKEKINMGMEISIANKKCAIIENKLHNSNTKNSAIEIENDIIRKKLKKLNEQNEKYVQEILELKKDITFLKSKTVRPTSKIIYSKNAPISKDSEKYKATLDFLNDVLRSMNKPEIDDITKFSEIKRSELLSVDHKKIVEEHSVKLLNHFKKKQLKYNCKDTYTSYCVTLIKILALECGYNISTTRYCTWDPENKLEQKNGRTYSIF